MAASAKRADLAPIVTATPVTDAAHDDPDSPGSGFVLVSKPMLTVKQFSEWMQQVHLPSADVVMRGGVQDDVIYLLVSRRTFINDALRAFHSTMSTAGGVDDDAWPALWLQFQRDFPRESVSIDGASLNPELPFEEVRERIRSFISDTLPEAAVHRIMQEGSVQSPIVSHEVSTSTVGAGTALVVDTAMKVLTAPAVALIWSLGKIASLAPKSKAASPATGSTADAAAAAGEQHFHVLTRDEIVATYTRLVVLMAQQAVLALPLEMVHAQFCADIEAQLFVGELSHDDPSAPVAGMRVQLNRATRREGAAAGGAMLTVSKLFRVFSLVDSRDYTLFYIDMKLELDLFSEDENIAMVWNIIPAGRPRHPPSSDIRAQNVDQPDKRRCDCLGGPAGFHKASCPLARP